ncbi:MAG: hypothetical protein CMJ31_14700 [Phycisphaerae bacterium]|nr:hypothetical protein [Phycisphaerae bacterium]
MEVGVTLLILVFAALLLMHVPVAFAVGVAAVVGLLAASDAEGLTSIAGRMAAGVDSFPLLAIPFFVLAGNVMGASGTAKRLVDAARVLVGWMPGGLSLVNVVSCMLFGSISGSAAAAISSIGGVTIPALEAEGEDRGYATALSTTAATTGLLIPPSNVMIVYAVVAQTSVAALFFAGIGPGILLGMLIMVAALLTRRADPAMAARARAEGRPKSAMDGLVRILLALPSLTLIVVVLGGILGGVFSATEAAAVSVLLAFVIGVFDRFVQAARREEAPKLTMRSLPRIVHLSTTTTAIVMFLIATSQAMSWVLAYLRIPQTFATELLAITSDPIALLVLMNVTLLVVGTFLDMTPAILIFTPIFLPVAESLGLHPAHFGIVMILNLSIGLCTPPVGTCLFVGCSVGKVSIPRITKPILPFYGAMVAALAVTTGLEALSMWLPSSLDLIDPGTPVVSEH